MARTVLEFREAVLALSDDPSTRNVNRYLAASRALVEREQDVDRRPRAFGAMEGDRAAESLDTVT